MERELARRIDELADDVSGLRVQLAELSTKATYNGETLDKVLREVGGISEGSPNRRTLRQRVHYLEQDRQAITNAANALEEQARRRGAVWTRRQKIGLFIFAAIAALLPIAERCAAWLGA